MKFVLFKEVERIKKKKKITNLERNEEGKGVFSSIYINLTN